MKLGGVDIGGTFTGVVFADTETNDIRIHKVPTTPDDPWMRVTAPGKVSAVLEATGRQRSWE